MEERLTLINPRLRFVHSEFSVCSANGFRFSQSVKSRKPRAMVRGLINIEAEYFVFGSFTIEANMFGHILWLFSLRSLEHACFCLSFILETEFVGLLLLLGAAQGLLYERRVHYTEWKCELRFSTITRVQNILRRQHG